MLHTSVQNFSYADILMYDLEMQLEYFRWAARVKSEGEHLNV